MRGKSYGSNESGCFAYEIEAIGRLRVNGCEKPRIFDAGTLTKVAAHTGTFGGRQGRAKRGAANPLRPPNGRTRSGMAVAEALSGDGHAAHARHSREERSTIPRQISAVSRSH